MVILRGCARCGGDIITSDANNIRCLQCGHRPELPVPQLRRRRRRPTHAPAPAEPISIDEIFPADRISDHSAENDPDAQAAHPGALCPRCDQADAIPLEKLRPHFNTCYRCRLCGHIFSPAPFQAAS